LRINQAFPDFEALDPILRNISVFFCHGDELYHFSLKEINMESIHMEIVGLRQLMYWGVTRMLTERDLSKLEGS
jgi:hypothetical protein